MDILPLPMHLWWPWDQPAEKVAFDAEFSLNQPADGVLHVAASGPYRAWLDGQLISVPEQPYPSWRVMHALPLNLAASEHRLNFECLPGDHGQPFLMACLDWQAEGHPRRLASGPGWRMAANPNDNWQNHPAEIAWRPAWAFDGVWAEPWGMPCNAPEDFCRLSHGWHEMKASRLDRIAGLYQGQSSLGSGVWLHEDASIEIRPPKPYPAAHPKLGNTRPRVEWYRTREAHSMANNDWLDLFEARAPHAVFDAGSEVFARLVVRVRQGGPAIIAVTTGESRNEVQRYHRRVTDVFRLEDGQSFVTTPTGFRYAKVTALSSGSERVILEPIGLQEITYPVEAKGQFNCNDPVLETIWALSAKTVHLCMQNEIWDAIKRDQLTWAGDLFTEALAIYHAFGDYRLVRHSLAIQAEMGPVPSRPLESLRYPGLRALWKGLEGAPHGSPFGDLNGIPANTMWWLIGLADYVRYSGDQGLAVELADEIEAYLAHIAGWVGEDGIWHMRGGWDLIDWAPVPAAEREIYCHLLACRAMRLGAGLLVSANRSGEVYQRLYAQMADAARRTWPALCTGLPEGKGSFGESHHVNTAAIASGILSSDEAAQLFANTLYKDTPLQMTFWFRFLDLNVAADTRNVQWGLDYLRRHWGPALSLNPSTLWETFDLTWAGDDPHAVSMVGDEYAVYGGYETSLCHGWSAGPAAWLHTAILGVQPAQPGFASVAFRPCLGDLTWARGAIPTPHGPIQVSLRRKEDGRQVAEISAPAMVEIIITDEIKKDWDIIQPGS